MPGVSLLPKAYNKINAKNKNLTMSIFEYVYSLQMRRHIIPQTAQLSKSAVHLSTFLTVIVRSLSDTQHGWCVICWCGVNYRASQK